MSRWPDRREHLGALNFAAFFQTPLHRLKIFICRHEIRFCSLFELYFLRSSMDLFRIRLNCIDHYQAAPTEFDPELPKGDEKSRSKYSSNVPIIRVFGATESGQKVCAHIHGAFPYLYVHYDGALNTVDGQHANFFKVEALLKHNQWIITSIGCMCPLTTLLP